MIPRGPALETEPWPLSPGQARLWFIDRWIPESTLYNIHDAMPWKGRLDRVALERALGEVVRRHEVLRTTFTAVDGVAMQVVGPAGEMRLEVVDLSGLGEEERAEEAAVDPPGEGMRLASASPPLVKSRADQHDAEDQRATADVWRDDWSH